MVLLEYWLHLVIPVNINLRGLFYIYINVKCWLMSCNGMQVLEHFYKCTHPLIKVKCSSPFNLDLRKIFITFFLQLVQRKVPYSIW